MKTIFILLYVLLCVVVPAAMFACCIEGILLAVRSGDHGLLIASAIFPPIATLHGIGHFVGFWL